MEGLPEGDMVEKSPQQRIEMEVPYVDTMRREAKDKIAGHDKSLSLIFEEINKQAIDSFQTVFSEKFSGVSFSTIHLSVTPELVQRISGQADADSQTESAIQSSKDQVWFMQPAFGIGAGGNAFSVLDMGIDRFIREMPKVAYALKHGERPPKIDIYVLGSPMSFAGTVTKDWNDEVGRTGFDAHGRLYAEFVEKTLPENLDNTRVIVTGASRGSVTSERTYHFLPENIKSHTQGLYDIPVGGHSRIIPVQILKTINMGIGMGTELGVRMVADRTTHDLMKTDVPFLKKLSDQKNIPQDTKEQASLKLKSFLREAKALGKGTPPDFAERGYYRAPDFDPTNIKPEGLVDRGISLVKRRKFAFRSKGNKLTISTSRKAHNFPWKKSFARWGKAIEYCETSTV